MPNLLESCQEHFETKDLYDVLGIPKSSTESEVKRAYHKGSLRYHPDRVEEDEKDEATKKFQTLGKIYALLSDKDKRAVYDESGEVGEDDEAIKDRDWDEYWRLLFPKITLDDVKNFEEKYKGSEEELEDLKSAYTQYSGDMDRIMESVLCCTYEDEERFQEVLRNLIKTGELQSFPKFSRESKAKKENRKKRMQREASEAEKLGKELGLDEGEDSLRKAIQKRQELRDKDHDAFFDHLEDKYAKGGKKGKVAPKKDKLSGDEVEESAGAVKSSRGKKNDKPAKKEPSDDEVSDEKPVNKRGRKPQAEKPSTDTGKESKPSRAKRGGLADPKEAETAVITKPRSRRAVTNKEPKYNDDNSEDDAEEKIAKPKVRKAAAKAVVDPVDEETEAEKKPAKPKRGGVSKKSGKSSDTQEVETAKGSKPTRKKAVTKPVKESSEEEDDNEAKGDGDHVTEVVSSDEDVPRNGFGDDHEQSEVKATKGNRATSQKTTKNAEKIDPPATKKSKVDTKTKRAKK